MPGRGSKRSNWRGTLVGGLLTAAVNVGGPVGCGVVDGGVIETGDESSSDGGFFDTSAVRYDIPWPETSGGNAVCGNDITEEGEWCDDGNDIVGDGCHTDCHPSGSRRWGRTFGVGDPPIGSVVHAQLHRGEIVVVGTRSVSEGPALWFGRYDFSGEEIDTRLVEFSDPLTLRAALVHDGGVELLVSTSVGGFGTQTALLRVDLEGTWDHFEIIPSISVNSAAQLGRTEHGMVVLGLNVFTSEAALEFRGADDQVSSTVDLPDVSPRLLSSRAEDSWVHHVGWREDSLVLFRVDSDGTVSELAQWPFRAVHAMRDTGDGIAVLENGDLHAIGVRTFDYDGTELDAFGWEIGEWGGDIPMDLARTPNGDWAVVAQADAPEGSGVAYLRFDPEGLPRHHRQVTTSGGTPHRVLVKDDGRVFVIGSHFSPEVGLMFELRP